MVDLYRTFLYEFQPLQNMDRSFRCHTANTNCPRTAPGSSRCLASAATNSGAHPSRNSGFASPPPRTRPRIVELGILLADFDLDEEPVPPLSQPVSSSWGPPLRPAPLSAPPFVSESSAGPGFNNPSTTFPADMEMKPAPPPVPQQQPGVYLQRCRATKTSPPISQH
jgi:hypothetical protein